MLPRAYPLLSNDPTGTTRSGNLNRDAGAAPGEGAHLFGDLITRRNGEFILSKVATAAYFAAAVGPGFNTSVPLAPNEVAPNRRIWFFRPIGAEHSGIRFPVAVLPESPDCKAGDGGMAVECDQEVARVVALKFLVRRVEVKLSDLKFQTRGREKLQVRQYLLRAADVAPDVPLYSHGINRRAGSPQPPRRSGILRNLARAVTAVEHAVLVNKQLR